jgi:acyl-CoA synthetase (AMP-forming)/AMP-acid ligase II
VFGPDFFNTIFRLEFFDKNSLYGEVNIRKTVLSVKQKRPPGYVCAMGVLYTGDIGRTDEEGYSYIVDRKKNMIISHQNAQWTRDVIFSQEAH